MKKLFILIAVALIANFGFSQGGYTPYAKLRLTTTPTENNSASEILVRDSSTGNVNFVKKDSLKSNDIPLTGTVTGNPVVGDIEFNESIKIFHSNGDYGSYIKLEDGGVFLEGTNENSELTSFRFDQRGEITFESNTSDSKGIIGNREFNYDGDRKVYVQKGYVDDAIITGGGSYIPLTQKGANLGVATLDSGGKVPLSQINDALIGSVNYQGGYNASTNSPTLPTATGNKGKYYVVSTAGTQQSLTFAIGDWIISNGTIWQKVDNNNAVTSVASRTGAITLTKSDVGLSNVDNTTDAGKPVSTATLTALNTKLSQGGNSFGTTLQVGSSDAQNVSIMRNNTPYLQLMSGDVIQTRDDMTFYGIAGPSFSSLKMGNPAGTNSIAVRRNRPDAVSVFTIENQNISSIGNLLDVKNTTSNIIAGITYDGRLFGSSAVNTNEYTTLGQIQTAYQVSSASTLALTSTNPTNVTTFTGTTAVYTLPTISNGAGKRIVIINAGSGIITLNSNSGGLDIWDSGTNLATMNIMNSLSVTLFCDGVKWRMID